MTVAVAGAAGRAVAAGGTRAVVGGGNRAGAGKVIDGRVVARKRPANARPAPPKESGGRGRSLGGDLIGGLAQGSAISRGLRSPAKQERSGPGSPARRVLVAEFAACMALLAVSPVTERKKTETPAAFMKRASAIMIVFFVLGLIASGGRGASRAAAGFGALVTLGLAISSRSIFVVLASKIGTSTGERPGPGEPGWDGDKIDDGLNDGGDNGYAPPQARPGADPGEVRPR